jgi:hypothetical protein
LIINVGHYSRKCPARFQVAKTDASNQGDDEEIFSPAAYGYFQYLLFNHDDNGWHSWTAETYSGAETNNEEHQQHDDDDAQFFRRFHLVRNNISESLVRDCGV